jgi:hypothetical protein
MRTLLSLESLHEFDFGKASVTFAAHLKNAVRDILDRPGDKTARSVVMEVKIAPVLHQDGDVVDANVQFLFSVKIPKFSTAERPLIVSRQGDLFFQPDAPDNPRQSTLGDAKGLEDRD